MRALFAAVIAAACAIAFAFLLLPIVAIFVHVPLGDLLSALGSGVTRDALVVSLKTSAIAHALVLLVGTPVAYLLGRRRFPGRGVVLTLVELPLVLPPAVAGVGLIAAFGPGGTRSDWMMWICGKRPGLPIQYPCAPSAGRSSTSQPNTRQ